MALGQILTHSISRSEQMVASAPRPPATHSPALLSKNVNRLVSAAIVSPRFRHLLLTDPVAALATGYNGEDFQLTPAEYAVITSLKVSTIRDFAAQLLRRLQYAAEDAALYATEGQTEFRLTEVGTH
jgi:hypothetical protein